MAGITQLTGDVTTPVSSGPAVATIASGVVTGAKIASGTVTGSNIASSTITNAHIANVDAAKVTTGTLSVARGGTGLTSVPAQRVLFGNSATALGTNASFVYNTTNNELSVGGAGSARVNAIVATGSKTALQAYNSSGGNAFQASNVSAWTAALISRQNNALSGASISMEFGRGTLQSPSQALSGDQIGVIAALPTAASGSAFGYCGAISFVASENATTTATGGELVLSTTTNGSVLPAERMRIRNSGETVFSAAIRTARYTTAQKTGLNAQTGWVVYDTDLNQLSYFNGLS